MKVLHINVSAICDRFYLTFFGKLKNRNIFQSVYVPYSSQEYSSKVANEINHRYDNKGIEIKLMPIKNRSDRIFYLKKIRKYQKVLKKEFKVTDFSVLHAHSLYSDGGVAYSIYKEYGIPYIVAVRGTDTEYFMKYYKWLNIFAKEILDNAAKIIFISPDLKHRTIELLYGGEENKIPWFHNCEIIPNGVDDFWLQNRADEKVLQNKKQINILQVSRLIKAKNVDKSVLAIKQLRDKGIEVDFYIAGKGNKENNIKEIIKKTHLEEYVHLLGFVEDKKDLLNLYRKCDIFLMPSIGETFGISYVEALTQGLPVIGLKGTGVGAYFEKEQVGCFIGEPTPEQIVSGVEKIIKNYELLSKNAIAQIEQFNWKKIIDIYTKLYKIAEESRM